MKAAVVYWSGTGNTAAMAELVLEGMKAAGAQAELLECNSVTDLSAYDAIAFGCPAMGSESLEDGEFEPMFDSVKKTGRRRMDAQLGGRLQGLRDQAGLRERPGQRRARRRRRGCLRRAWKSAGVRARV